MKIEISKSLRLKDQRKAKLLSINSDKKEPVYGFYWRILEKSKSHKEADENVKDLQKFCLMIARDIFNNSFLVNEKGLISRDIEGFDSKTVIENINKLLLKL